MDAIVDLNGVFFSYGSMLVVEDVNLAVRELDFLGIIGPNGGGKTTIIKLVLGLLNPDRGKITVFGERPEKGRRHIGYVPQQFGFDPDFPISVLEVVLMGRYRKRPLFRRYGASDREAALEALEMVGMAGHAGRQIGELSGGERQRTMIARAIASEPKLLLLDEPLSSIDSKWQASFYRLIEKLNEKAAVMLVTHDILALSAYIDQVACLNRRLYYHGETREGIQHLVETYECPIELIAHGLPHRVLEDHDG